MYSADLWKEFEMLWVCPYIGLGGPRVSICGFLISYAVLQVPLFLIFVSFALYTMRRQKKILKEMLAIDLARGLIPQKHGEIAVSAFRSSAWLIGGLFSGKFRARSRYLRAIGKLGLSYWHIQRATAALRISLTSRPSGRLGFVRQRVAELGHLEIDPDEIGGHDQRGHQNPTAMPCRSYSSARSIFTVAISPTRSGRRLAT